jgi:hypothetical protein
MSRRRLECEPTDLRRGGTRLQEYKLESGCSGYQTRPPDHARAAPKRPQTAGRPDFPFDSAETESSSSPVGCPAGDKR